MTEVVAALIWDQDKFMISSAQHIRQEDSYGSSLAER